MFIYKNTEYFIGYCKNKYSISIPSIKFFKEYEMKQDYKNLAVVNGIAENVIKNTNDEVRILK